jgi:hypothetical protein
MNRQESVSDEALIEAIQKGDKNAAIVSRKFG